MRIVIDKLYNKFIEHDQTNWRDSTVYCYSAPIFINPIKSKISLNFQRYKKWGINKQLALF